MRKHRAHKNASPEVGGTGAENLPIEVKFSEGTPGTAFPTVALGDDIAMNGVGSLSIFREKVLRFLGDSAIMNLYNQNSGDEFYERKQFPSPR